MPVPELRQWQAYAALHPIGPSRDDWRVAQLAALYFNAHRGKGKPPAKISEFMWQPPHEDSNDDENAEALLIFLEGLPPPPVMN